MSRPRKTKVIEDATSTQASEPVELSSRTAVSLYVSSDDATGLAVEAKVRVDEGEPWAPVYSTPPSGGEQVLVVEEADMSTADGETREAALESHHHVVASEARVEITGAPSGSTDV